MLERSPSSTTTPVLDQRQPRRHVEISGQCIAKNHGWSPRKRVGLAARWLVGCLRITPPTMPQAEAVFGVGEALIREELYWLKSETVAAPAIDNLWASLPDHERNVFVRDNWPISGIASIPSPAETLAPPEKQLRAASPFVLLSRRIDPDG